MVESRDDLLGGYDSCIFSHIFQASHSRKEVGFMVSLNEIQTFFLVLLAICGAITTIGGAINLIRNWKKESKVERHDGEIKDHEKRIQKLEEKTKDQDGFIKVLCNSILALVSHEINGNSTDKLRDAQKELQDFLINR